MSAQGHRVTGKVKVTQSLVIKLHEATQMLVDYIRQMTVKSYRYGEYGSFEHVLFFFRLIITIITGLFDCYCTSYGTQESGVLCCLWTKKSHQVQQTNNR